MKEERYGQSGARLRMQSASRPDPIEAKSSDEADQGFPFHPLRQRLLALGIAIESGSSS